MDYQIKTNFTGANFTMVPNAVAQGDLSAEALGVLVYLASLPDGFTVRVTSIRDRFGIGKDKWQRIARELKDAGAMHTIAARDAETGRAFGRSVLVQWPEGSIEAAKPAPAAPGEAPKTESRKTRPSGSKPRAGKPGLRAGKPARGEPENPALYKDTRKTKGAQGRARAQEAPSATPSASPAGGQAAGVADLSKFKRDHVLGGGSVQIEGIPIAAGTRAHDMLRDAISGRGSSELSEILAAAQTA